MGKLEEALKTFLGSSELTNQIARVLAPACETRTVSYAEVEKVSGNDAEDLLLVCWKWRLLLPIKSLRGSAWEDRILNFEENERYHMPRVVKLLVENADETGEWDIDYALSKALDEAGESHIEETVGFLRELIAMALRYEVEVDVMRAVRADLGIEMDMHETLDRFVRCGIMSPRTGRSLHMGSAKYEINPCLYWQD